MTTFATFFSQGTTDQITAALLGHELQYQSAAGLMTGIIVEAEAYMGAVDSAAHAYQGHRSPANEALYAAPGTIYIYQQRGYYMLDVAAQAAGEPEGILIRGVQPLEGLTLMQANRPQAGVNLTNGPGKLTQAFGIQSKALNLTMLGDGPLTIDLSQKHQPREIEVSPRIGVSQRGTWTDAPLRFSVAGNPYVSQQKKRAMDWQTLGWQES